MTVDRNQPADRDEARRLADAATPAPWVIEVTGGVDTDGEGWSHLEIGFNGDLPSDGLMMGDHENADHDAAFIAAARSLVPALLDEIETLEATNVNQAHEYEHTIDHLRTELAETHATGAEALVELVAAEAEIKRLRAIDPQSETAFEKASKRFRPVGAAALVPTNPDDGSGADRG